MIYSVIPARSGSKGVPDKNIKLLGGYPLIAYAITASKLCNKIDRTIVSTDSKEIARIAVKYGAEAPFLRPAAISQDRSTDLELFQHAIAWFEEQEGRIPQFIIHLRPTTPLRDESELGRAIEYIQRCPDSTSLRSVHELAESPHKVFQIDDAGFLNGFFPDDPRPEYYNLPRQSFPKAYYPNGYVDIVKPDYIEKTGLLHGARMIGFVTAVATEVDRPEDFDYLEYQLNKYKNTIYGYLKSNFPKEG